MAIAMRQITLNDAEQTLRMNEALADGLHVAEWSMGDEVIRSYGRTPEEAKTRLLASIEAEIWIIDPRPITATKADGTLRNTFAVTVSGMKNENQRPEGGWPRYSRSSFLSVVPDGLAID